MVKPYRQLGMATTGGAKSMEKLSSGYRINRAGDDAAGLAISEKMRGQIRGLNRASANAQDGISLIQTAEGALNETHAILQRMRELAVQSATDTNTETDRGEIQKEINQLTSEINRIGNTTEFNTMKLVDGSRANEYNVTTSQGSKVVNGTGGDVAVNSSVGVTNNGTTAENKAAWGTAIKGGITLADDPDEADAIKWSAIDGTKDAKVTLTKDASGNLKIDLKATNNTGASALEHSMTISAETLKAADGSYKVDFHGVSFDLDLEEFAKADGNIELDLTVAAGNTAGTDAAKNYKLNSDYASGHADFKNLKVDGTNSALAGIEELEIELSADGTTVTITGTGSNGAAFTDKVTLTAAMGASSTFKYNENGIEFEFETNADTTVANRAFKTEKLDIKGMMASTEKTTIETKELTKDKTLAFQVGANESQSMSLEIGDMRAAALGISSAAGGAGFAADMAITDGTDNTAAEYSLNVTNRDDAASAITTIQSAIDKVSSQRSALGAVQNRLEHTIKNLDTSSENLQASEARIRDVDMAKEMMEQTKQNILSQAATAMLAQANQAPQGVLQLLR